MSDRSDTNGGVSSPVTGGQSPDGNGMDAPAEADGSELAPVPGAWFAELPVLSIRPNPRQPRTVFDDDDMAELAHSIARDRRAAAGGRPAHPRR